MSGEWGTPPHTRYGQVIIRPRESCENQHIRQQSGYHGHCGIPPDTAFQTPTMSAGNNVLEEQPLLSNSKPSSYHPSESSSRIQDEETATLMDEDETNDLPKEPWTRRQIAVYSTLTLLGLFILAIFIKGFIDADDVEVCVICRGLRYLPPCSMILLV